MAWNQDDYDALDTAIKQGVESVQYSDRMVKYRSLKEMLLLKRAMARELGLDKAENQRKVAEFSKGLK